MMQVMVIDASPWVTKMWRRTGGPVESRNLSQRLNIDEEMAGRGASLYPHSCCINHTKVNSNTNLCVIDVTFSTNQI